jgi:hypothetical protein
MTMVLTVSIPLDVTDILKDLPLEYHKQAAIEHAFDFIAKRVECDILLKQLNLMANTAIDATIKVAMMEAYSIDLHMIRNAMPAIEYKLEQK